MKKFIYTLGLTLACGLVANAAVPQKAVSSFNSQSDRLTSYPLIQKAVKLDEDQSNGKKKAKRFATKEDYIGDWQWFGLNNLLEGIGLPIEGVMTISASETNDSLIIKGFDLNADNFAGGLKGYMKNGRLYIPNQVTIPAGAANNLPLGAEFVNYTGKIPTDAEWENILKDPRYDFTEADRPYVFNIVTAPKGYDFFLAMDEDGDLVSSLMPADPYSWTQETWYENYSMPCCKPVGEDGYFLFVQKVQAFHIERFEFNPVEWENVGEAKYKDAWMAPIAELDQDYDVPLWRNVLNPQRFLLQDPYGPNTPWAGTGWNVDEEREGYIVFDIAYTGEGDNVVIVEPFVYALSILYGDAETSEDCEMYNYNEEAYFFYIQGQPIEKIIELMDYPSWYDEKANKVEIYNGLFDLLPETGFASEARWYEADGTPTPMDGYVIFPEDVSSVDRVLGEEAEVAPVYYNLQGVRVNNPEKGQLLIVKKGDKTVKQIIR